MKVSALFCSLFLTAALAFGQHTKIASELQQQANSDSNVDVIVQFDQDPTAAHHQKVTSRGGFHRGTLHSVHSGVYTMPASALADLASDPSVVHISQDHKVTAKLDYATAAVNASAAWDAPQPITGMGIGVALLDSGVGPSADLSNSLGARIVFSKTFVGSDALDHYGHGEHIAGIISASGGGSSCSGCIHTFKGVAPQSNIYNFRVLDQNGETTDSILIAAIENVISLKNVYNLRVINLSIGRPVFESYKKDPLCQAVEAAWKAGIVVVVSAGNDGRDNAVGNEGYGTINSPGNDPYVITVGAMKTNGTYGRIDDTIASYSSKGPSLIDDVVKPDIVAPGNKIVSLLPALSVTLAKEYPGNLITKKYYDPSASNTTSSEYYSLSGTSMAAGVVTGAVADLLQAQPNLTPDQVKVKLMKNAYKTFPHQSTAVDPVSGASFLSYYDIFTVGAGYLDIATTLADKSQPTGNSLSPTATFKSSNKVDVTYDPSSAWANSSAWGAHSSATSSAWGASFINSDASLVGANSSAWGASSSWGASGLFATSANSAQSSLWSDSSSWGASSASASSSSWGAATEQNDSTPIIVTGEQ